MPDIRVRYYLAWVNRFTLESGQSGNPLTYAVAEKLLHHANLHYPDRSFWISLRVE